jgi:hypothetical protein
MMIEKFAAASSTSPSELLDLNHTSPVTPAKAGVHHRSSKWLIHLWIPAFAGMTGTYSAKLITLQPTTG